MCVTCDYDKYLYCSFLTAQSTANSLLCLYTYYIHIFFKKFQNSMYNCVAYAYTQQTFPQPFIPNRYFTGNTLPCSLIVNLMISGPRRWRSGLEHWFRKRIVGCSNPSCDRPMSLIQVVTAPLLNAR